MKLLLSLFVIMSFKVMAQDTHEFQCDSRYNQLSKEEITENQVSNPKYIISLYEELELIVDGKSTGSFDLPNTDASEIKFFVQKGQGLGGKVGVLYTLDNIDEDTETADLIIKQVGGIASGVEQKMKCLYLFL